MPPSFHPVGHRGGAVLGRNSIDDEQLILEAVRLIVLSDSDEVKPAVRAVVRKHPELESQSEDSTVERIAGKIYGRKDQLLADAKREAERRLEDDEGAILCGMSGADVHRLAQHVRTLPPKERSPLVIKVFRVLAEVDRMRNDLHRSQRREPWPSTFDSDLLMEHFFYLYTRVSLGDVLYDVIVGLEPDEPE